MRRARRWWRNCFLLASLALLATNLVVDKANAQAQGTEPVDVVLVIDDSGSMGPSFNANDVDGLRYAAARLLVDLAADGDRIAVVRFSNQAALLGHESACSINSPDNTISQATCPMQSLNTDADRRSYRPNLGLPDSVRGDTCSHLGLHLAETILSQHRQQDRPQAVLFLTDGNFNCPDIASAEANLADAVRHLGESGVTAYSILLGSGINPSVSDMLDDQTGGQTFAANNAEELLPVFSRFYAKVQPSRYALELQADASNSLVLETTPGQGVTTINFVVAHDQAVAVYQGDTRINRGDSSGGVSLSVIEDANPYRDGSSQYDIYQLRGNPLVGAWKLELKPGARRGLAVVSASTTPALHFPRGDSIFALRNVTQRLDGYLIEPVALRNGEPTGMTVTAPGQAIDQSSTSLRTLPPQEDRFTISVQAGDEPNPLQLTREFNIRPGDYPRLQVVNISVDEADRANLAARWDPSDIVVDGATIVEAVIVDRGSGTPYRTEPFSCAASICTYQDFQTQVGHAYDVWFLASSKLSDGTQFNDYATGELKAQSIIAIRGLPDRIDLIEDSGPYDLEVLVQTTDPPGELQVRAVDRQTGALLPLTATLALDEALTPSSTVTGRLIFDNLESIAAVAASGEVIFQTTSEVPVVPERVPFGYSPGIRLNGLPGSIALNQNRGPYLFEALLNSTNTTTALRAELRGTDGLPLPIEPILTLGLLQPGVPTPGQLQFSIPNDLGSGTFSGELVFSSPDGIPVEPSRLPMTFLVAPANVSLAETSQIDFGYWLDPSRPLTTTLHISYQPAVVGLRLDVDELSDDVGLEAIIQPPPDGRMGEYETELTLQTKTGELPTGDLTGVFRLSIDDPVGGSISPESLRFRFARPPAWLVYLWCNKDYPSTWAVQRQFCWFWPANYDTQLGHWGVYWVSLGRLVGGFMIFMFVFAVAFQSRSPNKKSRKRRPNRPDRRSKRSKRRNKRASRRSAGVRHRDLPQPAARTNSRRRS